MLWWQWLRWAQPHAEHRQPCLKSGFSDALRSLGSTSDVSLPFTSHRNPSRALKFTEMLWRCLVSRFTLHTAPLNTFYRLPVVHWRCMAPRYTNRNPSGAFCGFSRVQVMHRQWLVFPSRQSPSQAFCGVPFHKLFRKTLHIDTNHNDEDANF